MLYFFSFIVFLFWLIIVKVGKLGLIFIIIKCNEFVLIFIVVNIGFWFVSGVGNLIKGIDVIIYNVF